MDPPTTPPGVDTPKAGASTPMVEPEVLIGSPIPSLDAGTPVTYSPPGMDSYQEPPVLPGAFPIGGAQSVFKAVSA